MRTKMTNTLSSLAMATLICTGLLAQPTETVVFQPGPEDGNDAFVQKLTGCLGSVNSDDTNYGSYQTLRALAWTYHSIPENCSFGRSRTFIRFDGINSIPDNAEIISAELFLYGVGSSDIGGQFGNSYPELGSEPPNPIQIGAVTSMWGDQTITWNNQPEVNYSLSHGPSTQRYFEDISIDVTSIVQNQVAGNNFGLGIRLVSENIYRSWYWMSSNSSDSSRRPKLVVEYKDPYVCDADFSYSYNTAESGFTFNINNPEPFIQYLWSFGDGTSVYTSGASVNHEYAVEGTYEVCLTKKVNIKPVCKKCIEICVSRDQVPPPPTNFPESSVVESQPTAATFIENLYPNPAQSQITVKVHAGKSGEADLRVFDVMGSQVGKKRYALRNGSQNIVYVLPDLKPGIYLCAILHDGHHLEHSFIVN